MSTLAKLALGLVGAIRPRPAPGGAETTIRLPRPDRSGGAPLMRALRRRRSRREFRPDPLPMAMLSNLLWAAFGVNRSDGHRTAPSAMDMREIDVYAALPDGLWRYDPDAHALHLAVEVDARPVTGRLDFVDDAPLDLVYVADHRRMTAVPESQRETLSAADAGFIAENVYLYCASEGLATVVRAWIDREALAKAMGLDAHQRIVLAQTVGYPASR